MPSADDLSLTRPCGKAAPDSMPDPLPAPASLTSPLHVAGKFLAEGDGQDWWLNGVSYGPFPPNAAGQPWPEKARLAADFELIRALGFNAVRLYEPPTAEVRAQAAAQKLRLLPTLCWTQHVDFLAKAASRQQIEAAVVAQARALAGWQEVAAILVGNEIEKSLVRWMGPRRVQRFLEWLLELTREHCPGVPCGYATYPSTEYLMPRNADFFAVNLYLEEPRALTAYLRRLQHLAGNKPLLITEFGLDVKQHGLEAQAEALRWQRRALLATGTAGGVWFAFTDEWQRGGRLVTEWQFGLVDAARRPRPACSLATALPRKIEPLADSPPVSVIVCTRNGAATLRACLESLQKLRYPNYEVLVIDDGSTDEVPAIIKSFPQWRGLRQEPSGLSVARNFGMQEASGVILAYTDDDCVAHPDWLTHLVRAFMSDETAVAVGGPNIPPAPRNGVEAVVAAAPGAPAQVMLNDHEAEHLPGCNLAIRKDSLERIGGFNPVFTTAGDDVDVCWRLRDAGGKLLFAPGAMVWHHRRRTARAYLRQQRGYGRAEALLMKVHPTRFGPLGGARWRGCIYGETPPTHDPVEGAIFFGPLGEGLFQGIYRQSPGYLVEWFSGLLWPALLLLALALQRPGLALVMLGFGLGAALLRRWRLPTPPHPLHLWQQLLLFWLCLRQPLTREAARVWGMLRLGARPSRHVASPEVPAPPRPPQKWSLPCGEVAFWSEAQKDRHAWLPLFREALVQRQLPLRLDDGWRRFDLEAYPRAELSAAALTVTEYHGDGRCLTRVRFLLRFTPGLLVAVLLMLALEGALLLSERELWQMLGAGSLVFTLAMLLFMPALLLRPMRQAAREAGQRAGLLASAQ